MKEISVSRIHCSIIYKNKKLLIKDKGSKFGTLIKVAEKL
jgi:pSer/pThr/pTyr-binding forkhead associated (FHA) protein